MAKYFKDNEILKWIDNELNGYTEGYLRDIPSYRKIKVLMYVEDGKKPFIIPYPLSIDDVILRSKERNEICKLIHYVDEPQLKGQFPFDVNVSEFKNIINFVNIKVSDYIQEKLTSIKEISLETPLNSKSNIRFKELAGYIIQLKDDYLHEEYSNVRVRIVAFNRKFNNKASEVHSGWEVLYFRLDFTDKNEQYYDSKYSHPDQQLVLFKEVINFKDLIEKMKVEGGVLTYESGEFKFKFIYSIQLPLNFLMFKEKVKPTYHIQQVTCEDQLSFVYFELLKQEVLKFNFDKVLSIEFKVEGSTKLRNSTEVINEFIGYNLNSLSTPYIIIVYPVILFKIISHPSEKDPENKIKITWVVNQQYGSSFRCKVLINGDYYDIPKEGLEIKIEDNSHTSFSCITQWNGESDLTKPNETLIKSFIENFFTLLALSSLTLTRFNKSLYRFRTSFLLNPTGFNIISSIFNLISFSDSISKFLGFIPKSASTVSRNSFTLPSSIKLFSNQIGSITGIFL